MERYIKLITEKYNKTKLPISVLDIGCGYGKQAYTMKK
jgi:ubiquinone/menaquinone biosynthesis C-methylase UbiE